MEFTYTGTEVIPEGTINLFCQDQNLINLPENLPITIQRLWCHNNQLTSLPLLPEGLKVLYCWSNQLTSLPPLPADLRELCCYDNQLTSLPPLIMFVNLRGLYCGGNQLTSLPQLAMLVNLRGLHCQNNQLTSLPPLPASLQILHCQNNQLTSLPPLPVGLRELNCNDNQLTSLPSLANTNITLLYCANNQLSLPFHNLTINYAREVIKWQYEIIYQENEDKTNKIKELEELTQKQQMIIEEMKLVPGYGEFYHVAEKRYNERQLKK
jgi:Leucine-rich repeat (LRR) protein